MAPTERLAQGKSAQRQVEAEESRRVDDDAIEAFVWPQRCGDVTSTCQMARVIHHIALKELSPAPRLFARHVCGHDAARVTGQALEQLNLTSKRQPSTQHAVAITYQLWSHPFELARRRGCDYASWRMQSCSEAYRAKEHRTSHDVEAGISTSARERLGECCAV